MPSNVSRRRATAKATKAKQKHDVEMIVSIPRAGEFKIKLQLDFRQIFATSATPTAGVKLEILDALRKEASVRVKVTPVDKARINTLAAEFKRWFDGG